MDEQLRKLHQRLDQIEHIMRQHLVRQNRLDKAAEEFRQFREETLKAADDLVEASRKIQQAKTQASVLSRLSALEGAQKK